ncbi:hypothetical protein GJAV_G00219130 [Gymnothorax javanicus]|nr:hypothetical protein GJAV_G00219130 [Gymnothorax javanicus]
MSTPSRHQQPSQSPFELHPHESAIPLDGMLVVPGTSSGTPILRSSPEKVRPYPKAGSRKENKRRGRKRSTAILTDTSVKAALEEETRQRGQKKQCSSKRPKKTLLSRYTATTVSRGNEEECLVCGETFASSLPGEVWVQCIFCLLWSHEACTEGAAHYICHNCDENVSNKCVIVFASVLMSFL